MAIENIDLKFISLETDEDKQQAIQELRQLIALPGWKFMQRVIESNIKAKEYDILNEINDKAAIFNEDDRQKDHRRFLIKLLQMPEVQLALLEDKEVEENYDPYFTTEELNKLNT